MVEALHKAGSAPVRGSQRAVHHSAHQETWHEPGQVFLDVSPPAWTVRGEGEEHAVAMSNIHLVQ